jgi:hypothetical protein
MPYNQALKGGDERGHRARNFLGTEGARGRPHLERSALNVKLIHNANDFLETNWMSSLSPRPLGREFGFIGRHRF